MSEAACTGTPGSCAPAPSAPAGLIGGECRQSRPQRPEGSAAQSLPRKGPCLLLCRRHPYPREGASRAPGPGRRAPAGTWSAGPAFPACLETRTQQGQTVVSWGRCGRSATRRSARGNRFHRPPLRGHPTTTARPTPLFAQCRTAMKRSLTSPDMESARRARMGKANRIKDCRRDLPEIVEWRKPFQGR